MKINRIKDRDKPYNLSAVHRYLGWDMQYNTLRYRLKYGGLTEEEEYQFNEAVKVVPKVTPYQGRNYVEMPDDVRRFVNQANLALISRRINIRNDKLKRFKSKEGQFYIEVNLLKKIQEVMKEDEILNGYLNEN